jgi:predicted subunit of tRNA(5-methylaminomethyl-2-thiouridylate) methyltransferase
LEKGPIIENIQQFKKLSLRVNVIPEDNLLGLFMETFKENIQHEVHLFEPKSIEKYSSMEWRVENKNMATRRVANNNYREKLFPSHNLTRLTSLTPQQMDKRREKGLCLNYDNK